MYRLISDNAALLTRHNCEDIFLSA